MSCAKQRAWCCCCHTPTNQRPHIRPWPAQSRLAWRRRRQRRQWCWRQAAGGGRLGKLWRARTSTRDPKWNWRGSARYRCRSSQRGWKFQSHPAPATNYPRDSSQLPLPLPSPQLTPPIDHTLPIHHTPWAAKRLVHPSLPNITPKHPTDSNPQQSCPSMTRRACSTWPRACTSAVSACWPQEAPQR
jgi:hypothetical protein